MLPDYRCVQAFTKATKELRVSTEVIHDSIGTVEMICQQFNNCAYRPVHLIMQSFVPPETYKVYGDKSICFVDFRILWTADALVEYFNTKITANNWQDKGKFSYRGFRPPSCTVGAPLSQHRFGRALDVDIEGIPASVVRNEVRLHPSTPAFRYITCIEDRVNWFHFDVRNTAQETVLIIQP